MGGEQAFQQMVLGNWRSTCKRMKLDPHLRTYINVNSKWIRDLNVRPVTIEVLEENTGRILFDTNCSNIFFYLPPKAKEIQQKQTNGT